MVLILLESLGALLLLVLIVWWTMFSGRDRGELPGTAEPSPPAAKAMEAGAVPVASAGAALPPETATPDPPPG